MANKRMFSLTVTDTDLFLDMPTSTQALYFHLGMHGDDDGFVGSPKKVMRSAGCNADDLKILTTKGFIIPFDSGVIVLRDWRINNDLKNDRYHETIYQDEKALLSIDSAKRYSGIQGSDTDCIQPVSILETEHNITEQSIVIKAGKPPRSRFVPPTLEEISAYCHERGNNVDPQKVFDYYSAADWKDSSGKPVRNWKQKIIAWERSGERPKQNTAPDLSWRKAGDLS